MMTGRLGIRSVQTPAGSENGRSGTKLTIPSAATSNVVASSVEMATNGSASRLTWLPSWLTVAADQSFA